MAVNIGASITGLTSGEGLKTDHIYAKLPAQRPEGIYLFFFKFRLTFSGYRMASALAQKISRPDCLSSGPASYVESAPLSEI
jgi:hypothetical protein